MDLTQLRAVALACTLSPSRARSSSHLMAQQVLEALADHAVTGEVVRIADHDVKPGVAVDMGDGDEWPMIRAQIMTADILVLSTDLARPSLQRRPARAGAAGRRALRDRRGGPHAHLRQGRRRVRGRQRGRRPQRERRPLPGPQRRGFSLAPNAVTYWVGEAMHGTDYQDLDKVPDAVASATSALAANTAHLARTLKAAPNPPAK